MAAEPRPSPTPPSPADYVAPRVRPRWEDFSAHLPAFTFDAIEAPLRALCAARATGAARQGGAQGAFLARVEALLRPSLGGWYGWRDWFVTSEAFLMGRTSRRAAIDQLPNAGLGDVNARVEAAMQVLRRWVDTFVNLLRAGAPTADGPLGAGGCATKLAQTFATLSGIAATGWRRVTEDLATWSLQARGLAVDEAALAVAAARLPDSALRSSVGRYHAAVTLVVAGAGATREDLESTRPWLSRLYRPTALRAAEAHEAVAGRRNAREAWEALATRGIIPAAWVDDPAREYAVGGGATCAHPPTTGACVLLASDVPGVLRAEALADEALARLRPWELTASGPRRWVFLRRGVRVSLEPPRLTGMETIVELVRAFTGVPRGDVPYDREHWWTRLKDQWSEVRALGLATEDASDDAVRAAAAELLTPPSVLRNDHPTAEGALASLGPVARCWSALRKTSLRLPTRAELTQLGVRLPPAAALPTRPGRAPPRLADLPDPFEPLLALWSLGYALRGSTRTPLALVALLP